MLYIPPKEPYIPLKEPCKCIPEKNGQKAKANIPNLDGFFQKKSDISQKNPDLSQNQPNIPQKESNILQKRIQEKSPVFCKEGLHSA